MIKYIIFKTYTEIIGAILGLIIAIAGAIWYFVQMRKIEKKYQDKDLKAK